QASRFYEGRMDAGRLCPPAYEKRRRPPWWAASSSAFRCMPLQLRVGDLGETHDGGEVLPRHGLVLQQVLGGPLRLLPVLFQHLPAPAATGVDNGPHLLADQGGPPLTGAL